MVCSGNPSFTTRPLVRPSVRRVNITDTDIVTAVDGAPVADADAELSAPLRRDLGWDRVQLMSQSPAYRDDPTLRAIRATATVRRGTRMVKVLSPAQFAGHLRGWLPHGFCYRACDVAHLRTPAQWAPLHTDGVGDVDAPVVFVLRWRAVDPRDYEVPAAGVQAGLESLTTHARVGPLVLGTGFSPSRDELIPEFITAEFADLPIPAHAQLLGYTPDGEERVLFSYQPEHGWLRLVGRWRHLLDGVAGVNSSQEYVPCTDTGASRLIGRLGDREYEAVADPPGEFRVRALTRAARYPVHALCRRAEQARWRGTTCWVLRRDDAWARLRLTRPDAESVARLGVRCYERGVYEGWAPTNELSEHTVVDVTYQL